jgi:hypothetical protein
LNQQALDLEKYAVAVFAVGLQMSPGGYRADNMGGLLELAAKHEINLPDWMKEQKK